MFVLDYEGIGRTSARPGPMTIARLADDAVDFLAAQHIRRADILGWSMGGFVAQTLAIRHPHVVRRVILCSSALGDGTARTSSLSGVPAYPAQWLFPFDSHNRARADAFERAVHSYPHYYEGSTPTGVAEGVAIFLWEHGDVPEGHHAAGITVPALIGGGAADVILPSPDTAQLAHALPHSRLQLYPDAGHAFLVQHLRDWTSRVDRFLSP